MANHGIVLAVLWELIIHEGKSKYRFYYSMRGATLKAELDEFKVTKGLEPQRTGRNPPPSLALRTKGDSKSEGVCEGESSMRLQYRFEKYSMQRA